MIEKGNKMTARDILKNQDQIESIESMKNTYISDITYLMEECEDLSLLDLIKKLLEKSI